MTLKEYLIELLKGAKTYIDTKVSALNTAIDGKAASGHSHSAATTSAAGFMTAAMVTKLNGIATGANKYTLPKASSSTLGGVKTTSTVTDLTGYAACPIVNGVPYYGEDSRLVSHSEVSNNTEYKLLFSSAQHGVATVVSFDSGITVNPSTNTITATTFKGALSGNATTATKVGSSTVGSATQPVYISSGTPTACTYTLGKSVPSNAVFTDTTYSAGTGISLSGTTFSNSGVRSISTGSSNGTISVNTNGSSANVAVKGLGSAAYTNSSAYATASHTHGNIRKAASARGSASSLSLSANTNTKLTLNTWEARTDTAFYFKNGGIYCPYTGVVLISGNAYFNSGSGMRGIYVKKGDTEVISTYGNSVGVNGSATSGSIIIGVNAGDVLYLYARSSIATTCVPNNTATCLNISYIE